MTSADQDRLIQMLEETFTAIPRPDCTKRVARSLDDEWFPTGERVAGLRLLDQEMDWREVKPDDICRFSDVLFWISPDGFRFYFPAFLRHAITHWQDSHDRVQLECMEVIGRQPGVVQSLTAGEAALLAWILTGLSVDPKGGHYDSTLPIQILESHATKAGHGEDGSLR